MACCRKNCLHSSPLLLLASQPQSIMVELVTFPLDALTPGPFWLGVFAWSKIALSIFLHRALEKPGPPAQRRWVVHRHPFKN